MSERLKWLVILITAMVLGACDTYKPPLETEPHALLKLKYSYNSKLQGTLPVRATVKEETLRVRATVKEGKNKHQSVLRMNQPVFGNEVPLQAILIRPGIDTEIGTWLGFVWETDTSYTECDGKGQCRYITNTDYNERGCQQMTKFLPQEGKVYLLDYNNPNVDKGCDAKIYEQIPQNGGKFKLKSVGF